MEKEYHLNLSLFTGLRKKIKTKEARIKELEDVINANAVVDCDEIDETEKQEVKIERADSISKTLPTSITKTRENYQNLSDVLEKNEKFLQNQKDEIETAKKLYLEEKQKRELAEQEAKTLQKNNNFKNFKQKTPAIILFLLLTANLIVLFILILMTKRTKKKKKTITINNSFLFNNTVLNTVHSLAIEQEILTRI